MFCKLSFGPENVFKEMFSIFHEKNEQLFKSLHEKKRTVVEIKIADFEFVLLLEHKTSKGKERRLQGKLHKIEM